jgi:hypothetical protein
VTRRAAIATGAAAYAGSMLWGTSAFAARTPKQLLEELRDEIRDSGVDGRLRSRLLALTGEVRTDLERGSNVRARKTLRKRVIPVLERNRGHHGLSVRRSDNWVAQAGKIASKIRDDGLQQPNGGSVYVFNCFNEPITALAVAGSAVGGIPGWSTGGGSRYTPAARAVPRTRNPTPGGNFAIGNNAISIPWDSFRGMATITIPDPGSGIGLDEDLILFVATNQATLLSTRGSVQATFVVTQNF